MSKRRVLVRDFLSHGAVFGWLITLFVYISFAAVKDSSLSYFIAAVFSIIFWVYFTLRLIFKIISKNRVKALRYSSGNFIFFAVTVFIALILSEYLSFTVVPPFAVWTTVFLCLSKAAYTHLESIDNILDTTAQFSNQPIAAIRRYNNKIFSVFFVLAAAVCLFLVFIIPGNMLNDLLFRISDPFMEPPENTPPPITQDAMTGTNLEQLITGEVSPVMQVIGTILRVSFIFALIFGGIAIIYFIFINLKGFRFEKRVKILDNGDLSESVMPPFGESVSRRFARNAGRMPSDPVRRAFYKKIHKHRSVVEKSDTADEMALKIKEHEDIGTLTDKYQRARYQK